MVREALQVTEVAIKLSALGIKNALALSLAYAKENPKVKGKTSLDRLLREGKELKIIALQSKDVGQFKELAKQYGVLFAVIKDDLRHSCASLLIKNKVTMKEVQMWLGHSSFSTTANIYAHIDVDSKMEAANMIASKINLGELPEKKKSPKRKIA